MLSTFVIQNKCITKMARFGSMTTSPNPSNHEILQAVRFHPFFQGVEESTALSLLASCKYKHYAKSEIILHAETRRTGLIFIIKGSLEVFIKKEPHDEVLEVVQRGELIGLSSLADFLGVTRGPSEATVEVRTTEAVEALHIPFEVVFKRWDDPNVRDYLLTQMAIRLKDVYTSLAEQIKLSRSFLEKGAILTRVQDVMRQPIVTVPASENIMATAQKMSDERVSSVAVVHESDGSLLGILTERDIVSRVVAKGMAAGELEVSEVMTRSPLVIERFDYYYEALSTMLLHSVKHLPVMEQGQLVGMVTLSDLLRKKNEGFIKTIRSIEEAEEGKLPQIKEAIYDIIETLLRDQVPVLKLLDTVTALYDRLVVRVVDMAVAKLAEESGRQAPGAFAFYQMGSSGRREQVLLTDQDHFLVYEEVAGGDSAAYFALLGAEITRLLELAGYRRCVGLMMASEEPWRGSVSVWEERLRSWMLQSSNEKLLLAQNFFSYRFVAGSRELHDQFEEALAELLSRSKIFLYRLAQVEREHVISLLSGAGAGRPFLSLLKREQKPLNMKTELLFPLHHSLQILSLVHGVLSGTPVERIERLCDKGVLSREFTEELMVAVEQVLGLFIRVRWESGGQSSVLLMAGLSSMKRQQLSASMKTFRELQSLVFAHFSL
jgi:CBS domain-containing protein